MAQMLLNAGADYRIRDNNYKTPLDYAARGTFPGLLFNLSAPVCGSYGLGTWLALFKAQNPNSAPPSFDGMPQRHEAGDLFVAAKLGDIVLVRRLMAKAMQVRPR